MEKKTKIKVALVLAIVIIAIIFILMILFVQGNNDKKNSIPTKTSSANDVNSSSDDENDDSDLGEDITLDDVESLAMIENTLVKVKSDSTYEIIKDFDEDSEKTFVDYTFDNDKAYVVYSYESDEITKNGIYSIDLLKSNYPEELIYESDSDDYLGDIIVNDNKIYYTNTDKSIVEYSIDEEALNIVSKDGMQVTVGSLAINKLKNILYYIATLDEKEAIYSVELGTSQTSVIINGFGAGYDLILTNEKYLICDLDDVNYLYNIENNTIWEIGPTLNSFESHEIYERIASYESNYIIYTDESKIVLKDFDGNTLNDSLYAPTEGNIISAISMITTNKLQIKLFSNENSSENKSLIIDFEASTISESENLYTNIINIK